MQPIDTIDLPMQTTWRASIALVLLGGLTAAALCGLELSGMVARDALLRGATDSERWLGIAVGLALQPFGILALWHGRLRIDAAGVQWLGLSLLCRPRHLPWQRVRRWGTAVATNRGRRERRLLFELHDGSVVDIKLAMYSRPQAALEALALRLGPAATASATLAGVRFDDAL